MPLEFLEPEQTPLPSKVGWAVVKSYYWRLNDQVFINDRVNRLKKSGLDEDVDFEVVHVNGIVKRIKFLNEEAFVYAKLMLSI